ncbi:fimbrial protein [Morganella morganii]|nr:fimbrial protein [Morganella morganii]
MKIKLLAALAALGMSGNALAAVVCSPVEPPNYTTETLSATSDVIKLRADAPIDANNPIGKAISPSLSTTIRYSCPGFSLTGERPLVASLVPYPGFDNMYKTNIEGIGVKFTTSAPDGGSEGPLPRPQFPLTSTPDPGAGISYVNIPQGRFNASFYKLSDNVELFTRHPDSNLLFNQGIVGYNNLEATTISIYSINNIYISGTPVCKVDAPLPVDFKTVNAAAVRSGVVEPFQFGIECKTDYGTYDVTASIKADNASGDGKYIKVRDSKNNDDSLIIEIMDGQNNHVMVDNSTKINMNDLNSGQKANFGWTAKLRKVDGTPYPAQGEFRASAIVTLDIK